MEELDKEKYYSISKSNGLVLRCPILDRCMRRTWTIYLFNYDNMPNCSNSNLVPYFRDIGILSKTEKPIEIVGEVPSIIGGNENSYFDNACPEVLLFDSMYAITYASGVAATSAQWDKLNNPKSKINECRHYSECPEYSKYATSNLNSVSKVKDEKIFNGDISLFGIKLNVNPLLKKLTKLWKTKSNKAN